MDQLYIKPILLSKKQIQQIRSGKLISIRMNKKILTIGKKGYTSRLARLLARKEEINAAIAAEKNK